MERGGARIRRTPPAFLNSSPKRERDWGEDGWGSSSDKAPERASHSHGSLCKERDEVDYCPLLRSNIIHLSHPPLLPHSVEKGRRITGSLSRWEWGEL